MLTDKKKAAIQRRLSENAPYLTPGEWYHEDVPVLLREIDIALKTCPSGGNDGYITPRPCQMANCEDCHAEYEATADGIKADRDYWKTRAEDLERKESNWWGNQIINIDTFSDLTTDRNDWKARAEALEKAILSMGNICHTCNKQKCTHYSSSQVTACSNWQFDQERFTDRPPTGEVERKGSDGVE